MNRILMISGKIGAGKTTVSDALCNELCVVGSAAELMAFGDYLKEILEDLFGIPAAWLWGTQQNKENLTEIPKSKFFHCGEKEKLSVRELMECFAEKVIKPIDEYAFVRKVANDIKFYSDNMINLENENKIYIVSDFRFPLEYAYFKRNLRYEDGFDIKTLRLSGGSDRDTYPETALAKAGFVFHTEVPAFERSSTKPFLHELNFIMETLRGWKWI